MTTTIDPERLRRLYDSAEGVMNPTVPADREAYAKGCPAELTIVVP